MSVGLTLTHSSTYTYIHTHTHTHTHTQVAIVPTNRGLARVDMITGIEYWLLPLDVSFSPLISHDGMCVCVCVCACVYF